MRPVEKYIILFLTKIYDRRMINNVFETRKNRRVRDSKPHSVKIHPTKPLVRIIHFTEQRPK